MSSILFPVHAVLPPEPLGPPYDPGGSGSPLDLASCLSTYGYSGQTTLEALPLHIPEAHHQLVGVNHSTIHTFLLPNTALVER